ncbi:hypothetical protein AXG93_93s1260 [Marchantia polymorpha subsp. ruderalis]|uniref:Uncharacterized protein n=1 Tax=Marchantia polymorpha subsp. ruderalis TaxID=1480154 RepID=A0A176WS82_MARPO|nr:hypothetical protein AXG93_93s1260 [Marchantia polymorpha subsp. ruderalis]
MESEGPALESGDLIDAVVGSEVLFGMGEHAMHTPVLQNVRYIIARRTALWAMFCACTPLDRGLELSSEETLSSDVAVAQAEAASGRLWLWVGMKPNVDPRNSAHYLPRVKFNGISMACPRTSPGPREAGPLETFHAATGAARSAIPPNSSPGQSVSQSTRTPDDHGAVSPRIDLRGVDSEPGSIPKRMTIREVARIGSTQGFLSFSTE